jgi:hypothetical protein
MDETPSLFSLIFIRRCMWNICIYCAYISAFMVVGILKERVKWSWRIVFAVNLQITKMVPSLRQTETSSCISCAEISVMNYLSLVKVAEVKKALSSVGKRRFKAIDSHLQPTPWRVREYISTFWTDYLPSGKELDAKWRSRFQHLITGDSRMSWLTSLSPHASASPFYR